MKYLRIHNISIHINSNSNLKSFYYELVYHVCIRIYVYTTTFVNSQIQIISIKEQANLSKKNFNF